MGSADVEKDAEDGMELFKILFAPGERGWAMEIPDTDLAIINNIPGSGDAHYGDVVKWREDQHGDCVIERVVLRQYPHQFKIRYPREDAKEHFDKLNRELRFRNCVTEGAVTGLMMVAAYDDVDVLEIVKGLGYPQEPE